MKTFTVQVTNEQTIQLSQWLEVEAVDEADARQQVEDMIENDEFDNDDSEETSFDSFGYEIVSVEEESAEHMTTLQDVPGLRLQTMKAWNGRSQWLPTPSKKPTIIIRRTRQRLLSRRRYYLTEITCRAPGCSGETMPA
jgi:hypothetical protein